MEMPWTYLLRLWNETHSSCFPGCFPWAGSFPYYCGLPYIALAPFHITIALDIYASTGSLFVNHGTSASCSQHTMNKVLMKKKHFKSHSLTKLSFKWSGNRVNRTLKTGDNGGHNLGIFRKFIRSQQCSYLRWNNKTTQDRRVFWFLHILNDFLWYIEIWKKI